MNWTEKSKWIWVNDTPSSDTYGEFFDTFTYAGGKVTMLISADANYTLFVNGAFADSGQYPDFPHYKVYDELDITKYCREGENKVALLVWYYGDYGAQSLTHYPGVAGVRYEIYQEDALVAFSCENVVSRLSPTYMNGRNKRITEQVGLGFGYDATKVDNWMNGELCGFANSTVVELDIPLNPRPIKKLNVLDRCESTLVKSDKNYALYDLGREEVGYLTFKMKSAKPQTIKICYGEHIVDGGVRWEIDGRDFSFDFVLPAGETTFTNHLRRLGLRYLEVHSEDALEVEYLSVLPTLYPLNKVEKHFEDPLMQKIYDVSVRTMELCMHDHYEDCPWREQGLYTMDSRNQMLCGYYAFDEYAFPRASLQLISKDHREDGLLSICSPSNMNLTIPSFSLHYFTQMYEYLKYSNDVEFGREVLPKLKSVMEAFLNRMEDGLVSAFVEWYHWNFYEWADGLTGDRGTGGAIQYDAVLNCLLSSALQSLQKICDMVGEPADYATKAEALNACIRERFYNPQTGLYINRLGEEQYSELVNSLMILCGVATPEQAVHICEVLVGDHDMTRTSLSMVCFKYDALLQVDKEKYKGYILENIREKYKKMLDAGATSFWETELGDADFFNAGSLCHGWSGLPVYYYHTLL